MIDLFIASGESKWQRLSGLVLMLPHGYEGLGPEHSSARPERFLQLCAEDNIQVCYPSTPAQYFHLLRRQMVRDLRKPLVVLTPKSLLRHPLAVSDLSELGRGHFKTVIDSGNRAKGVERVVICSGKIYYELFQRRRKLKQKETAIVRLEQFYPFPEKEMTKVASKYGRAEAWFWVQEEPENMGAWSFVRPRLSTIVDGPVTYVGRPPAASPATGFPNIYRRQQASIADQAIGPEPAEDYNVG
jgi:2-oxoglutarate dehydrogenase E1 component